MPASKTPLQRSSMFGFKIKAPLAILAASLLISAPQIAHADAGFKNWVRDFESVAARNGVSQNVYSKAFNGITAPDPEVLKKARFQPEFKSTNWQYFDNRVNQQSISEGLENAQKYASWLKRIEAKLGVDKEVLLAIWSMETNYGRVLENDEIMRPVVRSLATLAYADKRRRKFARTQLIAALKIFQRGDVSLQNLEGSWAGAMGHTQFIPTSFIAYGYDMDGNGRRDIWNSVPDALATAANLLRKNGWRKGHTWGYEVTLPQGRKFPGGKLSLKQWQAMGLRRVNGKAFPRLNDSAELKVPDGRNGPAFLVTKNFYVLKRYNNADKYALAVGLLADRLGGHAGPSRDWERPFTKLSFAETEELQRQLARRGLYDGKIDGKIGSGSIAGIKTFQKSKGLAQTGYPSKEILRALIRG